MAGDQRGTPKSMNKLEGHLSQQQIVPQYMDYATHRHAMSGVLRWVDTMYDMRSMLPPLPLSDGELKQLCKALGFAVVRRNAVKLHVPYSQWPVQDWGVGAVGVTIDALIVAAGNSSYQLRRCVWAGSQLLAEVKTILVHVGTTLTAAQPLPYVAALRSVLPAVVVQADQGTAATVQFIWRQPVRHTDCDELGHINNTVYPTLAEESRAVAARSMMESHPSDAAWLTLPLAELICDHTKQPQPEDLLEIAVCWDQSAPADPCRFCIFHVTVGGESMAVLQGMCSAKAQSRL